MTNLSAQTQDRTLEQIEGELENVKKAEAAITDELAALAGKLDQAVKAEAESTEQAVREGKTPKASKRVGQIEARISELKRHRAAIEPLALNLQAERTVMLLAHADEEHEKLGEAAEKALDDFRAAQEALNKAQSRVQLNNERRLSLREQLVAQRRALAQKGIVTPEEQQERQADQAEAQRVRDEAARWQPTYPIFS